MLVRPRRRNRTLGFGLAATVVSVGLLTGATQAPAPTAAGSVVTSDASAAPARYEQPNVVVIMADDMRVDDLRFMPRTRRLLGGQGVTYANSFSSYPLCCPARASFLTGQFTHNHRVWSPKDRWGFRSFEDESTLPVWLQGAGYQTGFTGKYLNGYGRQDTADGAPSTTYVPPGWTDWRGALDQGTFGPDSPLSGGTYRFNSTTLNVNGTITPHQGEYQSEMLADQSNQMIRAFARRDQPFFLYSSFVAPHHGLPREADDPRPVRRKDGTLTEIKTTARPRWVRGRFDDVIKRPAGMVGNPRESMKGKPKFMRSLLPINAAEQRAMLEASRQRAEAVYVLDQQVKRIVDTLRRTGELNNTIIAFTSDNGYFAGEHRLRQGKVLPYDPSLRVPLLIRGPGIPRGDVRTVPISTVDLAPTFAQAARATPGAVVDGRAMNDTFATDSDWDQGILTETGPRTLLASSENARAFDLADVRDDDAKDIRFSVGVRTGGFLYVELATGEKELYDMRVDPGQFRNVVDMPRYAGRRNLLAAELRRLKNCAGTECTSLLPTRLQTPRGR